jgi:hypothetical protein
MIHSFAEITEKHLYIQYIMFSSTVTHRLAPSGSSHIRSRNIKHIEKTTYSNKRRHPIKTLHTVRGMAFSLLAALLLAVLLSACIFDDSTGGPAEAPEEGNAAEEAPEGGEEPLVIGDYSQYSAIEDPEYYEYKVMGEIFVIKDWQSTFPVFNQLTIYGKIPFAVHPDQALEALEFKDPNKATILTGFGEGWGKITFGGVGTGGSSVCSAEFKVEFRLVGGLYPSPTCAFDVDIVTTYYKDNVIYHCVYNNGEVLDVGDEAWVDMFTDVKLPIGFKIPDGYVTRFAKTEGNTMYDLGYYLHNFYGGADPGLAVYENIPQQFYNTGCASVNLDFLPAYLPEGTGWEEPPSVWEIMLIPESQRNAPQP